MDTWLQVVLTSASAIVASSGFWAYMQRRGVSKSAVARLLMGLAYEKITSSGMEYIDRGYVTRDELEELNNFYYEPYKELGGNGVAEQVMMGVKNLPVRHQSKYAGIFRNEGFVNNVRVVSREERETTSE